MGSEQYQDAYEILSAALAFHMAFEAAKADDGKIDIKDVVHLMGPVMKLPAAIAGADKAIPQLMSMDAASKAEMNAKLALEYDIADDKIEAKVEAGIAWLIETGKFVGVLVAKPVA